jgi:hypothetical protein
MNYSIKEHKGKSARVVQVQDEEGGIIEHTMQEEVVENAIWKNSWQAVLFGRIGTGLPG